MICFFVLKSFQSNIILVRTEENNEFNSVNYWKNDLEKEKNSYYNVIGEEAMNDLLEE